MRYLIVGGVAGGASTAARLRRLDENAEIIIFERDDYVSYANCGLPYYVGGVIPLRDSLFVQSADGLRKRFNLDVRVRNEVTSIDRGSKTVSAKELINGREYTEKYDKLVLSPGAYPFRPDISGFNDEAVFTIRSVGDSDRIKAFIEEKLPKRAVVIGAGFIGLEAAENLLQLGINVSVVEMLDHVLPPFDYDMASLAKVHMMQKGVNLILSETVVSVTRDESGLTVMLKGGRALKADMIILSIGVRPDSSLAKEAGLEMGPGGGIIVDECMRTSDPDIYALGDAVEMIHPILGKRMAIPLAGPANKEARIVADNIVLGNESEYEGSIGTAIVKVFGLNCACTGVSERLLKASNIKYSSSITHGFSHASYYPGAYMLAIKLIFSPDDGRIYGAQVIGMDGVDKRIDLIAAVIKKNGTIYDLSVIEHAYAPPFSSAKDPVNVAGMVAENILSGKVKIIHSDKIPACGSDCLIVDVRTPVEFAADSIDSAVNIPLDELRERLNELPEDKNIILYCGIGLRAYIACRILMQKGYENVFNLSGGFRTYSAVSI
jgi:NADPH-dependent 2,4-dienoyl-CoA reductase/sulfur reductase-like enzyme/rhodanese-related sulfurtransferase